MCPEPNEPLPDAVAPSKTASLSALGCALVLLCAFFGWFCAGMQMAITSLAMRDAAIGLLAFQDRIDRVVLASETSEANEQKALVARWFAWYTCAFLFGAAAGGLVFGQLGDLLGRSKGMAASILCFSLLSGAAYFAQSVEQLLVLRFLACMGIGGMWPNGVALVSEAWPNVSRPFLAGVIGTAANIGIFVMATIAASKDITPEDWRWVMLVGAAPVGLGLFTLFAVPESPRWLAGRRSSAIDAATQPAVSTWDVFRPPILSVTVVGVLLATIPLVGGWGSANWMIPWAGEVGDDLTPPDPALKAHVGQARSLTGLVGSFLGGWFASLLGRRRCYFIVSLAALFCAQYAFWFSHPSQKAEFLFWAGALGFFSGIYFGWLPLFLPELFTTRVRSTGAGVSFNFGRILTALTVLATGALMHHFQGDYAQIGRITSLVFALGMIVIWFAPDTSSRQLED